MTVRGVRTKPVVMGFTLAEAADRGCAIFKGNRSERCWGSSECMQVLVSLSESTNEEKYSVIPGIPILRPDADETAYIRRELDFSRLDAIYDKLCWAGSPLNINPLHRQMMTQQDVLITQQADLHLD